MNRRLSNFSCHYENWHKPIPVVSVLTPASCWTYPTLEVSIGKAVEREYRAHYPTGPDAVCCRVYALGQPASYELELEDDGGNLLGTMQIDRPAGVVDIVSELLGEYLANTITDRPGRESCRNPLGKRGKRIKGKRSAKGAGRNNRENKRGRIGTKGVGSK